MSYDPIIHFYDNPGHPYWPNKNGGSGGGGIILGELVDITSTATDDTSIQVSTRAYDISGETWREIDEATGNTNVFYVGSNSCGAPCGCYLMLNTAVPSEWSPEDMQVTFNDEEINNFECRKSPTTEELEPDRCLFTMQIPQDTGDLFIDLGIQ